MKKAFKYLRIVKVDIFVYRMDEPVRLDFGPTGFELQSKKTVHGRIRYFMDDNGKFVHSSEVFPRLNVLKLIKKSGPAIGNCVTSEAYRGKSIYPNVINRIASNLLLNENSGEVFIIVNRDNTPSVRGIEKAGFSLYAKIKARRFLVFYFDKTIEIV